MTTKHLFYQNSVVFKSDKYIMFYVHTAIQGSNAYQLNDTLKIISVRLNRFYKWICCHVRLYVVRAWCRLFHRFRVLDRCRQHVRRGQMRYQ